MTTYTLAIGADMLLATVPDGGDLAAAVEQERITARVDEMPEYRAVTGCTLTDEEPEDRGTIIWRSGHGGWLADEIGSVWRYAVRS